MGDEGITEKYEGGTYFESSFRLQYSPTPHKRQQTQIKKIVRRLPEYVLNDFSHIGSRHSLSKPAALHQLSGHCPHLIEMEGDNSEGEGG